LEVVENEKKSMKLNTGFKLGSLEFQIKYFSEIGKDKEGSSDPPNLMLAPLS
jgi:hypothetical protein